MSEEAWIGFQGHLKKNEILSEPIIVKLPFECEEEIATWELLASDHDDLAFVGSVGSAQCHFVLTIDLKAVEVKESVAKTGGFRKLASPGNKRKNDDGTSMETGNS